MKKALVAVLCTIILCVWGATLFFAMRNNTTDNTDDQLTTTTASETAMTDLPTTETTEQTVTETTPAETTTEETEPTESEPEATTAPTVIFESATDAQLKEFRVNESGQIYVLMFHGFIPDELKDTYSDREYSMTFSQFRETLQFLYERDYRPITMDEFLRGEIDVPIGKIPIVLTFDDGRSGQFNLIEKDGKLTVNPDSAVGILTEFNKTHPDFEVKGTFYVNLGVKTFDGAGTLEQRLRYMIDAGLEIGSHTYTHEALRLMTTKDQVIYQMGKNQEVMESLIPGYKFTSLSLPYGEDVKVDELRDSVVSGVYNGTEYFHIGVLDCKWRPSYSPFSKNYNARSIYRVRADGLKSVDCDMSDWMLTKLTTKKGQFISDGNPDVITVPESLKDDIDPAYTQGRKILTYILD